MVAKVIIYTTQVCPYCVRAKALLDLKNVAYEELRVDLDQVEKEKMIAITGRRSVPQIIINDEPIGGCDDLYALDKAGTLNQLLGIKGVS
jgi:glutaredoxin 3